MNHILRCPDCGAYTIKDECGCGGKAVSVKPPKFSPEDKYAELRRKVKRDGLVEKGLL